MLAVEAAAPSLLPGGGGGSVFTSPSSSYVQDPVDNDNSGGHFGSIPSRWKGKGKMVAAVTATTPTPTTPRTPTIKTPTIRISSPAASSSSSSSSSSFSSSNSSTNNAPDNLEITIQQSSLLEQIPEAELAESGICTIGCDHTKQEKRKKDEEQQQQEEEEEDSKEEEVDWWAKYEPPKAALLTEDVDSDILVALILDSTERIKTRIAGEKEERRRQKEALEIVEAAEAAEAVAAVAAVEAAESGGCSTAQLEEKNGSTSTAVSRNPGEVVDDAAFLQRLERANANMASHHSLTSGASQQNLSSTSGSGSTSSNSNSNGYTMRRTTMRSDGNSTLLPSSITTSSAGGASTGTPGLLAPPLLAFKPAPKKRSLFDRIRRRQQNAVSSVSESMSESESSAMGAARGARGVDVNVNQQKQQNDYYEAAAATAAVNRLQKKKKKEEEEEEEARSGGYLLDWPLPAAPVVVMAPVHQENLAINYCSDIMTNAVVSPTDDVTQVECVSCLDDFSPRDCISVPCRHSYCRDCFERLISACCENEAQWPPKCCLDRIPDTTVLVGVKNGGLLEKWSDRGAEWNIPVSDRVYCSQPACGIWCRPAEIDRSTNVARCSNKHRTCVLCRGPQHPKNTPCPQDRDLQRTEELAEDEGWKRCSGCRALVEHREACQHMTCRCGAQFCYVCGARWRTCDCTMEQLSALKRRADRRRRERQDRESREEESRRALSAREEAERRRIAALEEEERRIRAAREEEELRQALALIAEFEREQALKAELLRQEQERKARERRQRELEEQIRREEERRSDIEKKFQFLRVQLAGVHAWQGGFLRWDHEEKGKEQREQLRAMHLVNLAQLRDKHDAAKEALQRKAAGQLAERKAELQADFTTRAAEQRDIEQAYEAKLRLYWKERSIRRSQRPGNKSSGRDVDEYEAEARMKEAMATLSQRMEAGIQKWRRWSEQEVERLLWEAHEEEAIHGELALEAERRSERETRQAVIEVGRKEKAEQRWLEELIKLRDGMLDEMEMNELDHGGADLDAWWDAEENLMFLEGEDLYLKVDADDTPLNMPGAFVA